jgi:hypothetical protein
MSKNIKVMSIFVAENKDKKRGYSEKNIRKLVKFLKAKHDAKPISSRDTKPGRQSRAN